MDLSSVLTLGLMALFLAVQPWSVLAAILLVTARDGLRRELAYVAGWVTVLAAVAIATVLIDPHVPQTSTVSQGQAALELVIGLVLGAWLAWRWRHPKEAGTASQPGWMASLDSMSPLLAFGLGAFLPTYAVILAAVGEMMSSGLTHGRLLIVALAWVLLASTGVASPLIVLLKDRERAPQTYRRWRTWILAHSRAVLSGVGGVVCLVLLVKGVIGLLG